MKISFCKGLRKPLDWPSTLFKNATDIPQALGCKWGPLTCHRQFEVPRSRQPFEGRERHRLLLLGLELHYRCMEIVAFSRQGRLVQGWFFRSWKEAPFARWKPDRRTLSSTCSCDGNMARILLAAFFFSLCCFHYPAGSMMPQTTAYNQKFSCAPPRLDQPYSEALQGLLHFFQQQREQTWQWRCAIETFWAICSLSRFTFSPHPVLFLAVREFWPIFICSAACI